MNIARLIALSGIAVLGASACSGDLTDPDLIRPSISLHATLTGEAVGGSTITEMLLCPTGTACTSAYVFPSNNEANKGLGWGHVEMTDVGVGTVELTFTSTRAFASCFEYRIDGEAPTSTANSGNNFNNTITDGMWIWTCRNNNSITIPFTASGYVDVRLAFGAERNERFDWTRFYVLSLANKDQCKSGQWEAWGFKNQGQCVRFVETGKDSRIGQ